jgi:ribosomal protein L21E
MATTYKEGDRVGIIDREANADDVKSGLFYNHFRGLTGTIQKIYATDEVAVEVEQDSLPEALATRHLDVQLQMKTKWMDGLSEEARNRLSEQERDFRLRYTVLVTLSDLTAPGAKPVAKPSLPAATPVEIPTPKRPTSEDLDAAEQAYLSNRQ